MQIVNQKPPFYQRVIEVFPEVENYRTVIFTYGDILYNPCGKEIPDYLMAHENVHRLRQQQMGIDAWWDKYLTDRNFRVCEEVAAYATEYAVFCLRYRDRNDRFRFLQHLAQQLCGPIYGYAIKYTEALDCIKYPQKVIPQFTYPK